MAQLGVTFSSVSQELFSLYQYHARVHKGLSEGANSDVFFFFFFFFFFVDEGREDKI